MSRIASSSSDKTEPPQASHGALGGSHETPLRLHELQCNFQRLHCKTWAWLVTVYPHSPRMLSMTFSMSMLRALKPPPLEHLCAWRA